MPLIDQLQSELGSTYRVDRELPAGGMARVFVATEIAYSRPVVIKLLKPDLVADATAERFTREIQTVAKLQQANIVPLFAAGQTSQGPFYTMPFVDGASLRERLANGPLTTAEAIGILEDVARALAYAHDAGIVHRDIKPENVLLSGGAAVVTDFGIAKAVCASRPDASVTITQVGMGVGTPAYMSPEQAIGDPSVDHRADIYAFGCLAYELLSGHPPFHGRDAHRVIAAHIAEQPASLSTHRPDISRGLVSLIDGCLEKDASRRPQSARDILGTLDGASTAAATVTTHVLPRRGPAFWMAVGSVIAAIGVGSYLATRRVPELSPDAASSLAVIPFVNIAGDSTQDYLADGVSDELATAIGKVSGLHVTARSAAYRYRGRRDLDVRDVGRALQARFLVQGTLRRAGDALRISAQLSDASSGHEIWSQTFDRTTGDVFRTQDEITAAIAKALEAKLSSSLAARTTVNTRSPGTANTDAYEHYLRGEFSMRRRQVPAAIVEYRAAIASDSGFGRAYAGLSQALVLAPYFTGVRADAVRGEVIAMATRALSLDTSLARAHMALGVAYMHAWQWREARAAYERAVAADANDLETRVQFGRFMFFMGDDSAALAQWHRAQTIDPFYAVPAAWIALLSAAQGNRAEAKAQVRRAVQYDSGSATIKTLGGFALFYLGDTAGAHALAIGVTPVPPLGGERGYLLARVGDTSGARAVLRKLESPSTPAGFRGTAVGLTYLGLADTSRALEAFERATKDHEPWPTFRRVSDPIFDPIRGSARWEALVRRVGLDSVPRSLAPSARR